MMGYGRGYGADGYGNMMGGGSWFGGVAMLAFGALVIVGIVVLIIWAVRASAGHGSGHHAASPPVSHGQGYSSASQGHDEAVTITKRRLASGEITPEQYAEIIKHLGA